ncbi:alpha-2-macroglobulin [Acidisoma sp. C75]
MRFLRHLGAAALLLGLAITSLPPRPAAAQDASTELALPGLQQDAERFLATLRAAHPAGLSESALSQAADDAAAALDAQDFPRAVASSETFIGGLPQNETPTPDLWRGLATAELKRTPPQPKPALFAAWFAFTTVDPQSDTVAADQLAALDLMRQAFAALHQPFGEAEVLLAMSRRLPTDDPRRQSLLAQRAALGLLFRSVSTEPDAFPTRACLSFLGSPTAAPDFVPGDWVSLQPAVKDAAVTLESHQICITGLPAGETTRVTLRQGMPGDGGLVLKAAVSVPVAMPDRSPRLVFDGARYLQPKGGQATVALASVNLSAVSLQLVQISERNLLHVMQTYPPGGSPIDSYGAQDLTQNQGRVVWTGHAAVAAFKHNALRHTILPLPPVLTAPGLYALIATPGDGTPFAQGEAPTAVQMILRTDLAPTVWQGADGDLVQVRSYATGLPVAGATVDLIAADNSILASAQTAADGTVRFAQPLLGGQNGEAPAALHVSGPRGDFTRISLTAPNFDLSDRGSSGQAQPGPIDPFLWTDRGIYRPGETVQVMGLIRDEAGAPLDLPLHLIITRPDGRVFADSVPPRIDEDAIHAAVTLSAGAPFGMWDIQLKTDPKGRAIADLPFQVDAFVPPRLAVSLGNAAPKILEPGRINTLPITVRFLYGAPGNDLSGDANITVQPNPTPFPDFAAYRFGLNDDAFTGSQTQTTIAPTDAAGATSLALDLSHLPDSSRALEADIWANINDPAGRSVSAHTTLPIRPAAPMIGIAEDFSGDSVNADTSAGFRLIALGPDGKRVAMPVTLRLVRQTPDWRLAVSGGQARYETVWHDTPVDSRNLTLPATGAPFAYARTLPFGRYKLEVLQASGGLAASSVVFYSGWAIGDNPDVPARVSVRADKAQYQPGETATLHVEAPYAGPTTVLVMTDRVKRIINLVPTAASFDVTIPVTADWGPGAYVGVHVFRPERPAAGGKPEIAPARAIGLAWVALDPAPRTLPLSIGAAALYRPRTEITIPVKTKPGAYVTLAAVDEGILALTAFKTPDPLGHFFGKRALGVGIHDDFARLLPPAGDANTVLHQGAGGDMETPNMPIPQKIVSLFAGPLQAGPDGIARFPLALPDFDGTLRLMAVGWSGSTSGSAGQDMVMRDRAIVEPLLPRFLSPGDQARIAILLQNVELPAGTFSLQVSASGAIALAGGAPAPITLGTEQRQLVPLSLIARGVGLGHLTISAEGPGGFHVVHTVTLAVHSARGPVAQVTPLTLPAGGRLTLTPKTDAFIPGTWAASATFGLGLPFDTAALVRALEAYPLDCLEQLASRGLPLTLLSGAAAGPDPAGHLQQVISALADRQRYDGAFGLWSASGDAEPWLTAYATEVLLRAAKLGAAVPQPMLDQALRWLTAEVGTPPSSPADYAAQAYALYDLALAGQAPAGAIRVAASTLGSEPTPLARAQIAAALARLGEPDKAKAIFTALLAEPGRQDWSADYGSALRDQFAIAVLIAESGVMPERLAAIRRGLPGAELNPDRLSTQEQAWAAAAAGALGKLAGPVSLRVDSRALGPAPSITLPLAAATTVVNPGQVALPGSLVVQGVPQTPPAAARAGMQLRRNFYALDGSTISPDKLTQNTTFVMVIDGQATDGQAHRALLLAGLPAGWEIAGRFPGGKVPGMDWLGTLTTPETEAAADDREAAVVDVTGDQPAFRLAVILRAVTPGTFEYPGMQLTDMYRPAIFARQNTVRITVLPAAP